MSPPKIRTDRSDLHHRAEALAAGLPPLLVAAERVASTVSQGVHGRRRVGQGETFWQFRRYEFGDATQMIDWRQSAKADPVYVREMEWEAAQSVWLWRDGSPSMDFRSTGKLRSKSDRVDLLLLALASLLVRGGERVALLGTGGTPSGGRGVLSHFCAMIEAGQTPDQSLPRPETLPKYARVVWLGDFLSSLVEIKSVITAYANLGVRGHLVQVLDPAEVLLPYDGRVLFGAMEGNERDVLVRHAGSLRDDYKTAFRNHQAGIRDICAGAGWSFTDHRTDYSPETVLLPLYLHLSESGGQ